MGMSSHVTLCVSGYLNNSNSPVYLIMSSISSAFLWVASPMSLFLYLCLCLLFFRILCLSIYLSETCLFFMALIYLLYYSSQLMDPKMDQCFNLTCSIKTSDLLQAKFPDEFTNKAALKIMISLIVQEMAFLDGASYLESTHQCIFMWEGSWER